MSKLHHTKSDTTIVGDRLLLSARRIGAALDGIEALAELAAQANTDRGHSDSMELLEPMTEHRLHNLLGAIGALSIYVRRDIQDVISLRGRGVYDGEELMMWGGATHMYPSHMREAREEESKAGQKRA